MDMIASPSENDGVDDIFSDVAGIDMAMKATTVDEIDAESLASILADLEIGEDERLCEESKEPHRSHRTAKAAPDNTSHRSLAEEVERSCRKLLPAYSGAVSARVKEENARAAAAGEHLRTDRKRVRDRLYQRAACEVVRPIDPDLDPRTLPREIMLPIVGEAKARQEALTGAMRAAPTSKRYIRLRGRQGEITGWWATRRMARAKLQREPSQREIALVRCLVTGVVMGSFTKRNAQSALDVIKTLELPGQPWHGFVSG